MAPNVPTVKRDQQQSQADGQLPELNGTNVPLPPYDPTPDGGKRAAAQARTKVSPHVSHNTGDYEWFTPPEYIEAARRMMGGGIDLDPASCAIANETVQATKFYTAADDGLTLPWVGRVWLNPPFSQPLVAEFVDRLLEHLDSGEVTAACCLTNNCSDAKFGQKLLIRQEPVFFPAGRIKFQKPEGASANGSLQGQMLTTFGDVDPARANLPPGVWRL